MTQDRLLGAATFLLTCMVAMSLFAEPWARDVEPRVQAVARFGHVAETLGVDVSSSRLWLREEEPGADEYGRPKPPFISIARSGLQVHFDSTSGRIIYIHNETLLHASLKKVKKARKDGRETGPVHSQSTLLPIVRGYSKELGIPVPNGFELRYCVFFPSACEWVLKWCKMIGDRALENEGIAFTIIDSSGQLLGYLDQRTTSTYCVDVAIGEEEAIQRARERLELVWPGFVEAMNRDSEVPVEASIEITKVPKPLVYAVRPRCGRDHVEPALEESVPKPAEELRLAYFVQIYYAIAFQDDTSSEEEAVTPAPESFTYWVDTKTGAIIGGRGEIPYDLSVLANEMEEEEDIHIDLGEAKERVLPPPTVPRLP